eukprot:CAMPEP_0183335518 /NCGR_PEP_ID=MMETSP0164_2-20130417/3806_1 /TAXON_ID=221442 /ORGANISM="Coccolithus pelagicus ssp braarudi, Strain PLY182g" /LENGTH=369 /DNA_ID=CAMNT_0025504901 /DNA_START=20 /DNA_END=1129 /DNA_ORIENTATION=-
MASTKGKGSWGIAAYEKDGEMKAWEFGRPKPGPNDVHLEVKFCGMCHSDIHSFRGEWGKVEYPYVPGHEAAGVVKAVGEEVKEFKVGDKVAVGCMVDSCRKCDECKKGLEQHCLTMIQTYGSKFKEHNYHYKDCKDIPTQGGYSSDMVVDKDFVFHVPKGMELKHAGVLLCAGITTYSPLARHVLGTKDKHVAVVGFGGLGHMTVKLAKAMGAKVTVLSRSLKKKKEAEALGAELVAHTDKATMDSLKRTFDVIIDTVAFIHDVDHLLNSLKVGGSVVFLGGVPKDYGINAFQLIMGRYKVEGSLIGGLPETQEMLDFCAKHNILPEVDVIPAEKVNEAVEAITHGHVAHRHVIDMSTLAEFAKKTESA